MLLSEGQMSDYKGAGLMLDALPQAALLGDKGYDADWFRQALAEGGIKPCIPPKSNRKTQQTTTRNSTASATKSRTCSEGSRTGGASNRYDRCAHTFMSAICIAASHFLALINES